MIRNKRQRNRPDRLGANPSSSFGGGSASSSAGKKSVEQKSNSGDAGNPTNDYQKQKGKGVNGGNAINGGNSDGKMCYNTQVNNQAVLNGPVAVVPGYGYVFVTQPATFQPVTVADAPPPPVQAISKPTEKKTKENKSSASRKRKTKAAASAEQNGTQSSRQKKNRKRTPQTTETPLPVGEPDTDKTVSRKRKRSRPTQADGTKAKLPTKKKTKKEPQATSNDDASQVIEGLQVDSSGRTLVVNNRATPNKKAATKKKKKLSREKQKKYKKSNSQATSKEELQQESAEYKIQIVDLVKDFMKKHDLSAKAFAADVRVKSSVVTKWLKTEEPDNSVDVEITSTLARYVLEELDFEQYLQNEKGRKEMADMKSRSVEEKATHFMKMLVERGEHWRKEAEKLENDVTPEPVTKKETPTKDDKGQSKNPKMGTRKKKAAEETKDVRAEGKEKPKKRFMPLRATRECEFFMECTRLCHSFDERKIQKRPLETYCRTYTAIASGMQKIISALENRFATQKENTFDLFCILLIVTAVVCESSVYLHHYHSSIALDLFQNVCFGWRKALLNSDVDVHLKVEKAEEKGHSWSSVAEIFMDLDTCIAYMEQRESELGWAPGSVKKIASPLSSWYEYSM
mmetsp:Transcript_12806/g.27359  ORF Transcript_12806/g.27359 Transcript_12806/m.27359 type:complete len:628 (-) Transcript_12806:1463-3346(-)